MCNKFNRYNNSSKKNEREKHLDSLTRVENPSQVTKTSSNRPEDEQQGNSHEYAMHLKAYKRI